MGLRNLRAPRKIGHHGFVTAFTAYTAGATTTRVVEIDEPRDSSCVRDGDDNDATSWCVINELAFGGTVRSSARPAAGSDDHSGWRTSREEYYLFIFSFFSYNFLIYFFFRSEITACPGDGR